MRCPAITLMLLALSAASPLSAQRDATVAPGQRVRVTSASFTGPGMVSAMGRDTLVVIVENLASPVSIPFPSIQRLEVRRQNSTGEGAVRGLMWGTAIGGGVGLLNVVFTDRDEDDDDQGGWSFEPDPGAILLSTTVTGAVIGAAWGAIRPGGRWERVTLPLAIGPLVRPDGRVALVGKLTLPGVRAARPSMD